MILLSFLVALSFKAQATPLIVEEVVDRKATVYVPPNVTVKPGDQLFTEMPVPQTAANPLSVSQTALPPRFAID